MPLPWGACGSRRRGAARYVPKVMVSIVDYDKSPQEIEACRKLAEDLGAIFRVRPFAGGNGRNIVQYR